MTTSNHIRPGRILLVDDDLAYRKTISLILREQGYHIQEAASGDECLRLAALWKPDIILLDVTMPGKDGFETCVELKNDSELGAIPVLFMTSYDDPVSISCAFELGAQDYITKPPQKAVLHARVRAHMLRQRDQEVHTSQLREKLAEIERDCRQTVAQLDALANDPRCGDRQHQLVQIRDHVSRVAAKLQAASLVHTQTTHAGFAGRQSTMRDLDIALGECLRHLKFCRTPVSVTRLGELPDAVIDVPPDALYPTLLAELKTFFTGLQQAASASVRVSVETPGSCRLEIRVDSPEPDGKATSETTTSIALGIQCTKAFQEDRPVRLVMLLPLQAGENPASSGSKG